MRTSMSLASSQRRLEAINLNLAELDKKPVDLVDIFPGNFLPLHILVTSPKPVLQSRFGGTGYTIVNHSRLYFYWNDAKHKSLFTWRLGQVIEHEDSY